MSQVSKPFHGFLNDGKDPDHTEVIWKSCILSCHQGLFLILFLQPIKEQLEGLHGSTQQQTQDSIPILDKD